MFQADLGHDSSSKSSENRGNIGFKFALPNTAGCNASPVVSLSLEREFRYDVELTGELLQLESTRSTYIWLDPEFTLRRLGVTITVFVTHISLKL